MKKELTLFATFFSISLLISCKSNTNSDTLTKKSLPQTNNAIEGKILAGYQGWFNAKGDGSKLNWKHYGNNAKFYPGSTSIDFWPEMDEIQQSNQYKTAFKYKSDTPAFVFSSADYETVDLHFKWMKEYGIDGVFAQRFVIGLTRGKKRSDNYNTVFDNCFRAAKNNNK